MALRADLDTVYHGCGALMYEEIRISAMIRNANECCAWINCTLAGSNTYSESEM